MATTETTAACCSHPGCDRPGTSKCSACRTTPYCGPICQTAHWVHHKQECEGHLLKVGSAHLDKANGFLRDRNWTQALRYSDLALAKLNVTKERPLHTLHMFGTALAIKYKALQNLVRYAESLQCAKDNYNMWALARGPAHPMTIDAAFILINALLHNKEYEDAEFYARTIWEIIHTNKHRDNDIPGEQREEYVANAADLLAQAIYRWAKSGGIPPEEKQQAAEEAIARARQVLEIRAQQHGAESVRAAAAMSNLADVLEYFSDGDNDEVLCLYQQAIANYTRVDGSTPVEVALCENNLGVAYENRARRAVAANDLDREQANLELALPHLREAVRICQTTNHMDVADRTLRKVTDVEEKLQQARVARAAAVTG